MLELEIWCSIVRTGSYVDISCVLCLFIMFGLPSFRYRSPWLLQLRHWRQQFPAALPPPADGGQQEKGCVGKWRRGRDGIYHQVREADSLLMSATVHVKIIQTTTKCENPLNASRQENCVFNASLACGTELILLSLEGTVPACPHAPARRRKTSRLLREHRRLPAEEQTAHNDLLQAPDLAELCEDVGEGEPHGARRPQRNIYVCPHTLTEFENPHIYCRSFSASGGKRTKV